MFFPDLSPYSYLDESGEENALNFGWLDGKHDFRRGVVPARAMERLARLCADPVRQTRGYHKCEFCGARETHPTREPLVGDVLLELGSAEIRVVSEDGRVFAAPDMIIHYVRRHGYLPPPAVLDVLLARNTQALISGQKDMIANREGRFSGA